MTASNSTDSLQAPVTRLLPTPHETRPLRGLYLESPLEPAAGSGPFVYANFVTSLDGRIAVDNGAVYGVPRSVANPRDWRLFQELAARADCLITSGRFLRQWEAGAAQDVLPLGPRFDDLRAWRLAAGMPAQPDVAIVSASLDFNLPPMLAGGERRVWLLTSAGTPARRLRRHLSAGVRLAADPLPRRLDGCTIRDALGGLGYRRIYSVTGPQVMHTLVADGTLDALFLTVRHRLIGGDGYDSIVEGSAFKRPGDLELRWLYLDAGFGDGAGQHFLRFDAGVSDAGEPCPPSGRY